jgi:pimeloyl-ACP methyl ester carboxylesterase
MAAASSSMSAILRTMLTVTAFLCSVFILLCAFLYTQQERFIFFPLKNDVALARAWQAQRVEIASGDTKVEGWWADNSAATAATVILYFGGNGEDVLYAAASAHELHARRLLVTNYRGYGASQGNPGQAALFEDALAIYDYALQQPGMKACDIVVMGRSLGSGVATYLAANRPVRSVILVTPFDSILAIAKEHYPFFPVSLLLRHPFPSDTLAAKITVPAMILAGDQDQVVPAAHARRLFDALAGQKSIHVLEGAGHNSIQEHPDYYHLINEFLDR